MNKRTINENASASVNAAVRLRKPPSGVEMTDDERAACEASGCTVWTMDELRKLIGMAMRKGYEAGKKSL